MEFRVLGPLEVLDGGRPLDLGAPRQRALFAFLLLHANEVVSTDRLAEALWPEEIPRTATKAIQVYVSALRKALGDARDVLETRGPATCCASHPGELDLHEFERLLARASDEEPARGRRRYARRSRSGAARRSPTSSTSRSSRRRRRDSASCVSSRVESRIEAELELGGGPELVAELQALVAGAAAAGAAARAAHARALPRGAPVGGARRVSRGQAAARRGARARPRPGAARARAGDPAPGSGARRTAPGSGGGASFDRRRPRERGGPRPAAPARRGARARPDAPRARPRADRPGGGAVRQRRRRSTGPVASLAERGATVRVAAFSSSSPAEDVVRLAAKQDADLLLLSSDGDPLDGPLAPVFEQATSDLAVLVEGGGALATGRDRRSVRRVRARLGGARDRSLGRGRARAAAAPDRGDGSGSARPRREPTARRRVADRPAHDGSRRRAAARPARHARASPRSPRARGSSSSGSPTAGEPKGWGRCAARSSNRLLRRPCSSGAGCARAGSRRRRR